MNARLLLRCYEDAKDLYERCHCAGVQEDICEDLKGVRNALRDLVIEEMEHKAPLSTITLPKVQPLGVTTPTTISHEPNWVQRHYDIFEKLKKDLPDMFEEVE